MTGPTDPPEVVDLAAQLNTMMSGSRVGGARNMARRLVDAGWRRVGASAHYCDGGCAHTVDLMDPVTAAIAQALAAGAAGHCVWKHREGPDKLATFARVAAERALRAAGWTPPLSGMSRDELIGHLQREETAEREAARTTGHMRGHLCDECIRTREALMGQQR